MYSNPRGNSALLPKQAVEHIKSLCSAGLAPDAIGVLRENGPSYADGSEFFASMGHASLEHSDYERAFDAYLAAYKCAKNSGAYGPVSLLEKLCDGAQLVRLLNEPNSSECRQGLLEKIDEAILAACFDDGQQITVPLFSTLVMTIGEVGATERTTNFLRALLEQLEPEFGELWGANYEKIMSSFYFMIAGHAVLAGDLGDMTARESMRARGHYQTAREMLSEVEALPELQSYLSLSIARLHAQFTDQVSANMNLLHAIAALENLKPEERSLSSLARIVQCIAEQAIISPELESLHSEVVDRFELPIHHHIRALTSWTSPSALNARLMLGDRDEGITNTVQKTRAMIERAEYMTENVDDVSNQDTVQLQISKCYIAAAFDGDPYSMLSQADKALRIAARNPGAAPDVLELLDGLVWSPSLELPPASLRDMFNDILQIQPQLPPPHAGEAAEFKCQLLVGLIKNLERSEASLEEQREILLPAMKKFMEFLFDTEREDFNLEAPPLAAILRSGQKLWLSLPVGEDKSACAKMLTTLYQRKSPSPPEDVLEWLKDAYEIEEIAKVLYLALGETHRSAAAGELQKRFMTRIRNFPTDRN